MPNRRVFITNLAGGAAPDTTAPAVTGFAATTPANSTTVSITTFTADADAAAFLITENSTPPLAGAAGWAAPAPTTFAVSGSTGSYTLYPWVKDAAGNVSSAYGSPVTVLVIVAKAWFDASDISTLFQDSTGTTPVTADAQLIGRWADKSGNANHALQAGVDATKPIYKVNIQNSRSAAKGDGSAKIIETAAFAVEAAQPNTTFIIVKDAGANNVYADGIAAGKRSLVYDNAGKVNWFAGTNRATATDSAAATAIYTALWNGASSVLRKNGTQIDAGNVNTNGLTGITLFADSGESGKFSGYIMEFILVNASLSTPVMQAVEAYLNTKWAVF